MNKYLLAINTISLEQYNNYFKNLPIPYSVIKNNQEKFLKIISNNDDMIKSVLNSLWKNNIQAINVTKNNDKVTFCINININNDIEKKFTKQIREKLRLDNTNFLINPIGNGILQINITLTKLKEMLDFKNMINDYFLLRKNNSSVPYDEINSNLLNNILTQYSKIPIETIEKITEENRSEILHIQEFYKFNNNFVNPYNKESYTIEKPLEDTVTIYYIHSIDPIYQKFPFSQLTNDMKRIMCNRYFEMVINNKLIKFQIELLKESNIKINILYHNQTEKNLSNFGITGNTRLFDEINNEHTIDIFSNSNLLYFKIDGNNVTINEDLLGQIMITVLHEYRHVQQQFAARDKNNNNPLINAIRIFDNKGHDYYVNNYKDDPAELDANFYSFSIFKNINYQYGINNPKKIVLEKVKINNHTAEDAYKIFDKTFNTYEEVMNYLNNKLQYSINKYQNEIRTESEIKKR